MYTFSRTGNTAVPGKPGVASVLCLLARGDRVKCEAQNRVLSSAERLRMAGGQMLTASQNPALKTRSRRERAGQMVQGTSKKVQPP